MGGEKGRQPRIAPLGVALALAALIAGVSPVLATGGSAERSTAPGNNQSKIESRVLQDTAAGQKASFVIYLRDQADLSAAYGMRNQDARGRYVYKTLKAYAARTQAGIRALLAARDASYRPFWVANVIVARGDRSLVEALAERSDVESIESNDASNWLHSGGGICGPNNQAPCDDHSHGTHTTGTTSGDDGGTNQIGVAPGAKWIGCRNMDQGIGTPA